VTEFEHANAGKGQRLHYIVLCSCHSRDSFNLKVWKAKSCN
jgi:hypothetical protein